MRDKRVEGQEWGPSRQAGFLGLLQLLLNQVQQRVRVMLQQCVGLALLEAARPEGRGVRGSGYISVIPAVSVRQFALHPAECARKPLPDVGELLRGPIGARRHLKDWNTFWHCHLPVPGQSLSSAASLQK